MRFTVEQSGCGSNPNPSLSSQCFACYRPICSEYRENKKVPLNWEHRLMLGMAPDYDHLPLINKVGCAASLACSRGREGHARILVAETSRTGLICAAVHAVQVEVFEYALDNTSGEDLHKVRLLRRPAVLQPHWNCIGPRGQRSLWMRYRGRALQLGCA